jgi:acetylornithine deacetylase
MTAVQILAKLISFPVLGGESNLSIVHWIQTYLEDAGVATILVPNEKGNKASLHCRIGPAIDGGLVLSGHTDVVPVAGQQWESNPFVLTDKKDGKLYGRGSCDMKGFLACCLAMLPKFLKATLKKPIYFAFSYDEEIGCLGAPALIAHLQKHYTETPKYALIGEPSLMQPILAHKGICLFNTTVNGSAGHSSGILKEVSAVHEAARLILWLEDKMKKVVASGNSDDRFNPPHSSLHTGIVQGGIAANVIADNATFSWDARIIPMDNLEAILFDFRNHCAQRTEELKKIFPGFRIETIEQHPPVPPLNTQKKMAIVQLMQKINPNQQLGGVSYAAEAGQFAQAGFESIICGPGSIDQAHRSNEFIAKSELDKCTQLLQKLCFEFS